MLVSSGWGEVWPWYSHAKGVWVWCSSLQGLGLGAPCSLWGMDCDAPAPGRGELWCSPRLWAVVLLTVGCLGCSASSIRGVDHNAPTPQGGELWCSPLYSCGLSFSPSQVDAIIVLLLHMGLGCGAPRSRWGGRVVLCSRPRHAQAVVHLPVGKVGLHTHS